MQESLLKQIEQTQMILEQTPEWTSTYDKIANGMLDNKSLIQEFYKSCKQYDHLHFYMTDVIPNEVDLFKLEIRFSGIPIAAIFITKDNKTYITTELYNESNKDLGCNIQLKDEEWNSEKTKEFIEYFRGDIPIKNKGNEKSRIEDMLIREFSKTTSHDKLLTGIQPCKFLGLTLPIPISLDKEKPEYINILTRTKVRKLSIIEIMDETQTPETVLAQATNKALCLIKLLHSPNGALWYNILGFSGRVPTGISVKVCIATHKKLSAKCKEFEPFQIQCAPDELDFRCMYYDNDQTRIKSIKTNING